MKCWGSLSIPQSKLVLLAHSYASNKDYEMQILGSVASLTQHCTVNNFEDGSAVSCSKSQWQLRPTMKRCCMEEDQHHGKKDDSADLAPHHQKMMMFQPYWNHLGTPLTFSRRTFLWT
jgi:hypothetical protein